MNMLGHKIGRITEIAHCNSHMTPQIVTCAKKLAAAANGTKAGHQRVILGASVIIGREIPPDLHIAFQKPRGQRHHAATAPLAFRAGAAMNMCGWAQDRYGQPTAFAFGNGRCRCCNLHGIAPSLRYDHA
jgi:hypothetical protein